MTPVDKVDAVLTSETLPTYTEVMNMLHLLVLEVGMAPKVDTHVIYRAWSLLDRYSALKQKRTS